jgi:hypothetical protein
MVCGEVFKKPTGYRGGVRPFGARFRYYKAKRVKYKVKIEIVLPLYLNGWPAPGCRQYDDLGPLLELARRGRIGFGVAEIFGKASETESLEP